LRRVRRRRTVLASRCGSARRRSGRRQSQTPALVGAIIWILLAESLIAALLGLVDLEGVADYLPGRALSAFDGTEEDAGLSKGVGGAVGLAWVTGLGVLGYLRMSRQDVT
jgi:hypothetical protein